MTLLCSFHLFTSYMHSILSLNSNIHTPSQTSLSLPIIQYNFTIFIWVSCRSIMSNLSPTKLIPYFILNMLRLFTLINPILKYVFSLPGQDGSPSLLIVILVFPSMGLLAVGKDNAVLYLRNTSHRTSSSASSHFYMRSLFFASLFHPALSRLLFSQTFFLHIIFQLIPPSKFRSPSSSMSFHFHINYSSPHIIFIFSHYVAVPVQSSLASSCLSL